MSRLLLGIMLACFFISGVVADDIYEPNNTSDEAKSISNGTYNLYAKDQDWFKIYLKNGNIDLTMTPTNSVDLNMILYNQNHQIVASNFASSQEHINYSVAISGTYYILVEPTSSSACNYTLDIDYISDLVEDSYEPNNNFTEAKTIDKGTYTLSAQDEDWFKLDLQSGDLNLTMTPQSSVDLNMILYNDKQEIVAANFASDQESINYTVVTPGTYYIKVTPAVDGIYSNYMLSVDYYSKFVWKKVLDFGPIRDVSVTLYDIDKDGKDEIFIATSKGLDSDLNEIKPAGLICLEDDGTVKWTRTFPAIDTSDPQTGKTYKTTSVSTTPFFSDIDADGDIDIVIGVGADTFGEAGTDVVGQPGDKGGVYALDSHGGIKWFHQSLDVIGGSENTGDGRPDGVHGTPVVFDIDKDGKKEIIYGGWDQHLHVLNAIDGSEKFNVDMLDTIWTMPKIADINKDGDFDILVSADITENSDAGTMTGGIFHVVSSEGLQNIAGFDQYIGNKNYTTLKGKYEEQALWSSPVVADIDNDGYLEIIYGTGNFFHDDRGQYIRVWRHDGSEMFKLQTVGRTFSSPIVADINNDGYLEILTTTLDGYLFCWDHDGNQLFATQTRSYKATSSDPIFSSPIAVDINNDGYLEIIYTQGAQIIIVDHTGKQISDNTNRDMIFEQFKGSVAVEDIDHDGILDVISGGTTPTKDQAVVYRWKINGDTKINSDYKIAKYQFTQSNQGIENFVKRFYQKVLGRDAEPGGLLYWTDELATGVKAGSDVARGFIFSQEFTNKAVSDDDFITILYRAFFNREPDIAGFSGWRDKLSEGTTRAEILDGFLYSQEFANLCRTYNILPVK